MSCDYQRLPHSGIQTLQPYVPGKSIEELAREQGITDIIKLASNENPLGCSPLVREALAKMSGLQIATYPSPATHPLKAKLGQKLGVDEDKLIFGNGSDLLFTLILTTFGLHSGKHMLTHEKAFITYNVQAQTLGIPIKTTPLKSDWEVDISALINAANKDTAVIFLANPNNPTGVLIPKESIQELLVSVSSSTIVVLDEAYYEYAFAPNDNDMLILMEQFPNLIITRTFSKAYGLAGLRLGYAISNPTINDLLTRVQLPFTVNQVALNAGMAALDDEDFLNQTLELNAIGLKQMQAGLMELNFKTLPSWGNFITFDCGRNSLPIYQGLLNHGIIVRPLTNYGLPNHLRVTVGKKEHIERFLQILPLVFSNAF